MWKHTPLFVDRKVFLLRFDYKSSEEFNLSQEDKNKVDLPKHLSKGIAKVCSMINDHIMKELKEITKYRKKRNHIKREQSPTLT